MHLHDLLRSTRARMRLKPSPTWQNVRIVSKQQGVQLSDVERKEAPTVFLAVGVPGQKTTTTTHLFLQFKVEGLLGSAFLLALAVFVGMTGFLLF